MNLNLEKIGSVGIFIGSFIVFLLGLVCIILTGITASNFNKESAEIEH